MNKEGQAITVVVEKKNPRVEIQAGKWPLKSRLLAGLGILAGIDVTFRGPNFTCVDLEIRERRVREKRQGR